MSQTELLSKWANQKMYTSVKAYSGRFGVNVLIGNQNFYYGRPSHGKSTDEHVREIVRDALDAYAGHIHDTANWEITQSGADWIPGERNFTVWMPK